MNNMKKITLKLNLMFASFNVSAPFKILLVSLWKKHEREEGKIILRIGRYCFTVVILFCYVSK